MFGRFGLKRDVIFPTYGLAEHTVFVCSHDSRAKEEVENGVVNKLLVDKVKLESERIVSVVNTTKRSKGGSSSNTTVDADNTVTLVGCGSHLNDANSPVKVRIVNPDTREPLSEDKVGEIWVDSPSKAAGYWGLQEKSIADFEAQIEGGII